LPRPPIGLLTPDEHGWNGFDNSPGEKAPQGDGAMSHKHMGSSIDEFLREEGILNDAQPQAIKEAVAWQLAGPLKAGRGLSELPMSTDENG
jgi:hypothetical protein